MAFPSTFSSFNRPLATDRLNSPSHSALHNSVSSAIGQLEAVVGLTGASSVLGTIEGDLRSPSSGGGGHVQTAVLGGTGQTTFTKGDVLVAQSASVLSRLAVSSTTGQVLTVDPTQALGIGWAAPSSGSRININPSTITVAGTAVETPIASASIAGSVLGDSNGVRFTIPSTVNTGTNTNTTILSLWYGVNKIAAVTLPNPSNNLSLSGVIDGMIVGGGSSSTQAAYLRAAFIGSPSLLAFGNGTSSINSSMPQQLQIRTQNGGTAASVSAIFSEFDKIA